MNGTIIFFILCYLCDDTFLDSTNKNTKVLAWKHSIRYIIISNALYRRGYNHLLLCCISKKQVLITLEQAHSCACEEHFVGKSLVQKLLLMRYYQINMVAFVKRCHKCQQHINLIHSLTHELRSQVYSWPSNLWGLDIIGKIFPPYS